MQFILPIVLGLVAAASGMSNGSVAVGVIFGLVMAGMVWGAFFWRPGKSATKSGLVHTEAREPSPATQDIASVSPRQVGQVLAMSLDSSCDMQTLSAQVRQFVTAAGVPLGRYHEELVLLAAFAQDYAISTLLRNDPRQVEVLRGYREVWADLGSKNQAGAVLYQKFLAQCPKYAEAVAKTEPGSISSIALAFGEFLGRNDAGAQMVALALADGIYLSHIEGTALALQGAKLLAATQHVA